MPTIVLILRLQCNLVYEQDNLCPKCARSITFVRQNTQTDVTHSSLNYMYSGKVVINCADCH